MTSLEGNGHAVVQRGAAFAARPGVCREAEGGRVRGQPGSLALYSSRVMCPGVGAGEREAVLTLSVLVGAISIARAVDDPDLSEQIMANAAAALKQCILN